MIYQRQALLFDKSKWTLNLAKEYCKKEKIKYYKTRTHKNYWHFRLHRTTLHKKKNRRLIHWIYYRTKKLGYGVIEIQAINEWDL